MKMGVEVWTLVREGVPESFIAVGFFASGEPLAVEVRGNTIRILRGKEAQRIIETAKKGEKAFPDFVQGLDRAEVLEVEEEAVNGLAELLKKHEENQREIAKMVREIVENHGRKAYIKLHLPVSGRDKRLEEELRARLGPSQPGKWFYSLQYESYVVSPKFEKELLEILKKLYKGKHLYKKESIWNILDEPFQDSVQI
jgi:hypothetical protein